MRRSSGRGFRPVTRSEDLWPCCRARAVAQDGRPRRRRRDQFDHLDEHAAAGAGELTGQRDALAAAAHRGVGFDRGAYDTLTWLVTGGPGLFTGAMDTVPIGASAVAHELVVAEEILSGPPGAGRRYAAGVLQALLFEVAGSARVGRTRAEPDRARGAWRSTWIHAERSGNSSPSCCS